MGRKDGADIMLGALIFLLSAVSVTNGGGSESSERAVVKPDSLAVYAKTIATGQVKKYLKKGEVVIVDAEITDSYGVPWCGVREEGGEWMIGLVKCEGLDRKEPAKGERWRALPYQEEPPRQKPRLSPQQPVEPPKAPEQPAVPPVQPPQFIAPKGY